MFFNQFQIKTRVCSLVFFFQFLLWWESPLFSVPLMVGITAFFSSSYGGNHQLFGLLYKIILNLSTLILIFLLGLLFLLILWHRHDILLECSSQTNEFY